jgi:hypothetical protein
MNAFSLCGRFEVPKVLKSGGGSTTSSKVPVPSDHKSLDHKSLSLLFGDFLADKNNAASIVAIILVVCRDSLLHRRYPAEV